MRIPLKLISYPSIISQVSDLIRSVLESLYKNNQLFPDANASTDIGNHFRFVDETSRILRLCRPHILHSRFPGKNIVAFCVIFLELNVKRIFLNFI